VISEPPELESWDHKIPVSEVEDRDVTRDREDKKESGGGHTTDS
jgi:hypothetical protein